ncbi:MAG: hypothetical protein Q7R41_13240 [Phycisphaerales bacterium]|nr:hypothetical protein [Phycisphaerales bacterium]
MNSSSDPPLKNKQPSRVYFRGLHVTAAVAVLLGAGCGTVPNRAFKEKTAVVGDSHRFERATERAVLAACAAVLQNLGFLIEDGDSKLGVITASKERPAAGTKSGTEVATEVVGTAAVYAGSLLLAGPVGPLFLLYTSVLEQGQRAEPERQVLHVSVLARRVGEGDEAAIEASVTFRRTVHSHSNHALLHETLRDPAMHAAFFEAVTRTLPPADP